MIFFLIIFFSKYAYSIYELFHFYVGPLNIIFDVFNRCLQFYFHQKITTKTFIKGLDLPPPPLHSMRKFLSTCLLNRRTMRGPPYLLERVSRAAVEVSLSQAVSLTRRSSIVPLTPVPTISDRRSSGVAVLNKDHIINRRLVQHH